MSQQENSEVTARLHGKGEVFARARLGRGCEVKERGGYG